MRRSVALQSWRAWLVAFALATLGVLPFGGLPGFAGWMMGLAGASFGLAALWLLIDLIGRAVTRGLRPGAGVLLTILAFLAKIPVYVVLGAAARELGASAFGFFLAGVVLVYFAVVAWAAAR